MKLGAHFLPEDLRSCSSSRSAKADAVGYERAWFVDGQILWQDVYVYLTHGLAATERIVFGTGGDEPADAPLHGDRERGGHARRPPPGPLLLGIGRGDNAVRTLGLQPVPTRRLADVVPKLRDLLAGRPVDLDGADVRSAGPTRTCRS